MKKPQLFLLHFAGGNSYSYQFMISHLQKFEVISLELPGRGRRIKEDLIKNFDDAASDFFDQIKSKLTSLDFIIYGHSMGASVSLRLCNMLREINRRPVCIIVSGNPGPGIKENKRRYQMQRANFIEELVKLGGVPKEVIADKDLFDFFEPILRADFEIAEENNLEQEQPVNVPVLAVMGRMEEHVEHIENWKKYAQTHFNFTVLEGDHFFIHKNASKMASLISDFYDQAVLF